MLPRYAVVPCLVVALAFAARFPLLGAAEVKPPRDAERPLSALTKMEGGRPLTKERLIDVFGLPSEILAPDLWVYWNFSFDDALAASEGYDALTVRFASDGTLSIRLVKGTDLRALLAAHAKAQRQRTASAGR